MVYLLIWVASCVGAAMVASSKGRDTLGWFLLGVIIGPLAFIFSLIVNSNEDKIEEKAIALGDVKVCPYCAEAVKFQAIICKHCGKDLPEVRGGVVESNYISGETYKSQSSTVESKSDTKSKWDGGWF